MQNPNQNERETNIPPESALQLPELKFPLSNMIDCHGFEFIEFPPVLMRDHECWNMRS